MGSKKPRMGLNDRLRINEGLDAGESFAKIADSESRPWKTIAREVLGRRVAEIPHIPYRVTNLCVKAHGCEKRRICQSCYNFKVKKCSLCRLCNERCPDFAEDRCELLESAPYVCNACPKRKSCTSHRHYYYRYDAAQKAYEKMLSESRRGANITEEDLSWLNETLLDYSKRGLSIHAAMAANPEAFPVHEKTAYRYAHGGLLRDVSKADLPRAPYLKPRKGKKVECRVDKKCRINRTFEDYKTFIAENPGIGVTEMDTVEGRKGGKALLTFIFMPYNFMVARLVDRISTDCVRRAFEDVERLVRERFGEDAGRILKQLFAVILTDNGTEFSNPGALELDASGERRTRVFYCNPYASYEKPHVERNHEYIRMVLPKGDTYFLPTSFDALTQGQADLLMSHVNSYRRRSMDDRSPYDAFTGVFGEKLAEALGIRRIPDGEITLKPSLLGIVRQVRPEFLDSGTEAVSGSAK